MKKLTWSSLNHTDDNGSSIYRKGLKEIIAYVKELNPTLPDIPEPADLSSVTPGEVSFEGQLEPIEEKKPFFPKELKNYGMDLPSSNLRTPLFVHPSRSPDNRLNDQFEYIIDQSQYLSNRFDSRLIQNHYQGTPLGENPNQELSTPLIELRKQTNYQWVIAHWKSKP